MELIKLTESTYYIKNPTNIGIYKVADNDVYIIDSGNDSEAGKKIIKMIEEQGWNLKGIINTHSNADHIGGNKVIQDRKGAKIYAHRLERVFTQYPELESAFLYGGNPFKDLKNKFLCAKESTVEELDDNLPEGLEYFTLRGHFFDQIGIKTKDDIYFLGDSLFSKETIEKYKLFFIYDIGEYLKTLDYLETLEGKMFIPSHAEATSDIHDLIAINRKSIEEISTKIVELLESEMTHEELLKAIFDEYQLAMNANQFVLIGSTLKSYLSYLHDKGVITYEFKDNKMYWKSV